MWRCLQVAAKKEAPKKEEPKEEEEAPAPKTGSGFSFFGTGKVRPRRKGRAHAGRCCTAERGGALYGTWQGPP